MKKIILFNLLMAFLLPVNAQIAPAGSSLWLDDISDSNLWSSNTATGEGTVTVSSEPVIDNFWSSHSDTNGYIFFSSNSSKGIVDPQEMIFQLKSPISLPEEGKEHLSLAFEQFYAKRNSKTFLQYSTDGGNNWNEIEINKWVQDSSIARRFKPIRLPFNMLENSVLLRFVFRCVPEPDMEAVWIIDDISLVQLPVVKMMKDKNQDMICDGDSFIISANLLNPGPMAVEYKWEDAPTNKDTFMVIKSPHKVKVSCIGAHPGANEYSSENTMESRPDSMTVDFKYVWEDEELFLATVDEETGKTLVTWKKTPGEGTEFYRIYKGPANNEEALATLLYEDLPVHIDATSDPATKAERYKITAIDTCGNESDYSIAHATILMELHNLADTIVKLTWSEYLGFLFDYYYIMKGPDLAGMQVIDSVPVGTTEYIDSTSTYGDKYRVEVDKGEVYNPGGKKANSGPFSRSLSNLEDNRQQAPTMIGNYKDVDISVYPNPFNDFARVQMNAQVNEMANIKIFNSLGQQIFSRQVDPDHLEKGVYLQNLDFGQQYGVFLLQISAAGKVYTEKLVRMK